MRQFCSGVNAAWMPAPPMTNAHLFGPAREPLDPQVLQSGRSTQKHPKFHEKQSSISQEATSSDTFETSNRGRRLQSKC